jgi:hypothetical protein
MTDETRRVGEEAVKVADQLLEKRPNHMGAIRARGLIFGSLADAEADNLHLGKSITWYEDSARDWTAIVRIDPSNQIAWNNLSNSKASEAYALFRMGRIGDAREQYRAAAAVEQRVNLSAFLARTLSYPAGGLAYVEADAGDRKAAEAALAENARLTEMAGMGLPSDAYGRFLLREFAQQLFGYAIPAAAGDFQTVRAMAQGAIARIEQRKTEDASQELNRIKLLVATSYVLADACYRLKDYPAAEKAVTVAIENRQLVPRRTTQDARDAGDDQILASMIATRQGRSEDARRILAPVLAFHRGLHARGSDDLTQHVQLARALYAFALAKPTPRSPELAEAAAIIDRFPPAMRRQISVARLREWITEEQQLRH